ncbi:PREDICTED: mono [ADP-ribose] polymerase PARP16-like [Amphimedon queenslandica]|uniref:Poly [ADP-ribose] polymerase n=1 Tax=Amphimedon queenslandica TaxID=400682 RepID=A0A1X7U827_AMPQE|nr:PREDICTED: mono [ADP-ribose] polymerase PARP16-like [Amphimedon queenslandica]|eukprot:XP_019855808.1 PREDICTED: mono [ADP-ribose] polymerase PARP16-like [Amphimedon queenslandica]
MSKDDGGDASTGTLQLKVNELREALSKDMAGCDCLLSLFWSALSSYRHDTVLRPYPNQFILSNGDKDIDGLRSVFKTLPGLNEVVQQLDSLDDRVITLLYDIICTKGFRLSFKPGDKFSLIESQTSVPAHKVQPYCFFELQYSSEREEKWQRTASEYGTFLAYHGSRMENFHSIAHNGLLSHMNKVGIFGEGTYLSTDLSVCMNFSPSATSWTKSSLPPLCSMMAVCEVVSHPDIRSRVQHGGEPSINQKVPERYFVVTNDEMLRVKYILVFAQERGRPSPTRRWFSNHKWVLMVFLYLFLLLFLGLWNSRYVSRLYNQYTRRYITL